MKRGLKRPRTLAAYHTSKMRYATGICWTIAEELSDVKAFDEDSEIIEMTDHHWNSIAIPKTIHDVEYQEYAHIVVGVGRFEPVKKIVTVRLPCTTRDLLTAIHDFYKRPMTEAEILEIPDDGIGHHAQCLERVSRGEVVKTSDLNGGHNNEGRIFFEGVLALADDIYELRLGS